jgi:uncharacterized protein
MKITADTNVLISALFWDKGSSHQIISSVARGETVLLTSKAILEEVEEILSREKKFGLTGKQVRERLRFLESISKEVEPVKRFNIVRDDPDDNEVLECAFKGKADLIVSGDKHLKKLREFRGMPVMPPKEALEKMRETPSKKGSSNDETNE